MTPRSVVYGPLVTLDAGGNKWTNLAAGVAASDAATVSQLGSAGPVSSVFGRTGAVVAVAGDYYGAVPAALTGATQASRFAGATVSGAPVAGTFAVGDHVLSLADGKWYVCTVAGTPGTWVTPASGAGVTYGTPAVVLGTAAANGSIDEAIRRDSTIVAFDATVPSTQAYGDAAATGSAAVAARRDHKHAMPATPVTSIAKAGSSAITGAATLTGGTGIALTQSSNDISIAATGSAGAMTQLADTTLGSGATTIDLTSISGSYNHLRLLCQLRVDEITSDDWIYLRFNNDSGGNYSDNGFWIITTTFQAVANETAQTKGRLALVCGSTATANAATIVTIDIPNYTGTTFFKQYTANFTGVPTSASRVETGQLGGQWHSTAAITRITLLPTSNNFITGSRVTLYGIT